MNIDTIFDAIGKFFNTPFGFTLVWAAVMGIFVFLSSRHNPFVETWKKYEGSIITGIRLAERQLPDDSPNKGLAKLDAALRFVLKAYAEANNGKQPSAKIIESIRQGIQVKHSELDRFGGLSKPKVSA